MVTVCEQCILTILLKYAAHPYGSIHHLKRISPPSIDILFFFFFFLYLISEENKTLFVGIAKEEFRDGPGPLQLSWVRSNVVLKGFLGTCDPSLHGCLSPRFFLFPMYHHHVCCVLDVAMQNDRKE